MAYSLATILGRTNVTFTPSWSIALVNPGDDCGYVLRPVDGQAFTMLDDVCAGVVADATAVVTLAPGAVYAREFDLALPRWHVRMTDADRETFRGEIGQFNGWQRFRLAYQAPMNAALLSTPGASVWTGSIGSAAFSNRGRVD